MTRPRLTLVAGPNGSGKSSLTRGGAPFLFGIPVLDPDAIARTIQVEANASSALAAGREVLETAAKNLRDGLSFAIETTLSGKNYLQMMLDARLNGFEVGLIYVGTSDPDINVLRVAKRVRLGGHNVPLEDIHRRYHRSLKNLEVAFSRSDLAIIVDNSSEKGYSLVATLNEGEIVWVGETPKWAMPLRCSTESIPSAGPGRSR